MSNKKNKTQKDENNKKNYKNKRINDLEESYKIGIEYYEDIEETHN